MTQKLSPVKNDWCLTIAEDLKYLNINLSEKEISMMKKAKFKPTAGGPGGGEDLEEAQRQAAAMETLTQYFPEIFYAMVERRKKRKIFLEEVPLKAQLYALQGLSYFLLFAYSTNLDSPHNVLQ